MVKLQKSKHQFYVYLPRNIVEKLGWSRGDELIIEIVIVCRRNGKEIKGVLIHRADET